MSSIVNVKAEDVHFCNELKEVVLDLMKNGFNVYSFYIKDDQYNFIYAENKEGLAYIEYNKMDGYVIDTVHKPNKKSGTGFRYKSGCIFDTTDVKDVCSGVIPEWAYKYEVVRYKNMKEKIKSDFRTCYKFTY